MPPLVTPVELRPESITAAVRLQVALRPVYDSDDFPQIDDAGSLRPLLDALDVALDFPTDNIAFWNYAADLISLTSGSPDTLDLTYAPLYMPGEGLYGDLTGWRVCLAIFHAPADNGVVLNIAPASSNPYPLCGRGNDIDLYPGQTLALVCDAEELTKISASACQITFSTTNTGDQINYIIAAGTLPPQTYELTPSDNAGFADSVALKKTSTILIEDTIGAAEEITVA